MVPDGDGFLTPLAINTVRAPSNLTGPNFTSSLSSGTLAGGALFQTLRRFTAFG